MITAASIMFYLIGNGAELTYAIPCTFCYPSDLVLLLFISWMNDSLDFGAVAKMSGFTEKEALQTWTVTLAIIAIVGLIQVLLLLQSFRLS